MSSSLVFCIISDKADYIDYVCLQCLQCFFPSFWINFPFCKTSAPEGRCGECPIQFPRPLCVFPPLPFGDRAEASPSRELNSWCPLLLMIYQPGWPWGFIYHKELSNLFLEHCSFVDGHSPGEEKSGEIGQSWQLPSGKWCHPALGQPWLRDANGSPSAFWQAMFPSMFRF